MTFDELEERLDRERWKDDPEETHAAEEGIMRDILRECASGNPQSARLAARFMEAWDEWMKDETRWYA